MTIGLGHYLSVAAILFTLGIFGIFLNRKNVIIILMSIELILLAVNINLVAFSTHLGDIVGQIFALFVLTVAAAEAAIGLAILVVFYPQPRLDRGRRHQSDEGLTAAMYQAIVFLPLLGAILAGLIALAGARARCPRRGAAAGRRKTTRSTTARIMRTRRCARRRASSMHEPCTTTTTISASRAAAGSRIAELITTTLLMISMILSWIAFVQVGFGHHDARVPIFTWIAVGRPEGRLGAAHRHAHRGDAGRGQHRLRASCTSIRSATCTRTRTGRASSRYLSLFTFAMLMLVTADNLVQLFFGWEGVGLASYLLIGFWYHKPEANAAAIKAFVVNRVGDFGFALGIFALFTLVGAVDFDTVFAQAPSLAGKTIPLFGWHVDALTLICLLLFMGAMGKSAQFLLHTWLPDAMEGPTPVSALIHAATMVTAGVFMVARLSPLFELAPNAQTFVTFIGATTAFFAATIGLVQNDIKRIVAYSTCSQLGYMFVAMGVGRLFGRHVPSVHARLLQGAAVPRLRLGDPRDASRAGHPPHGRAEGPHPVHLRR